MCDLGLSAEYLSATIVKTSLLVTFIHFVSDRYEAVNSSGSHLESAGASPIRNHGRELWSPIQIAQSVGAHDWLPEIPLLHFDGDIYKCPGFRDQFVALIEQCVYLFDVEKFYYLIECLKGEAFDAIWDTPIYGPTFRLA